MRQYLRHPSDIPIEIEREDGVPAHQRPLRNVGLGGLCFHSLTRWQAGDQLRVRIPHLRHPFETHGQVTWCQPVKDGFEIGLRFLQEQDVFRARMVEQVCQIEHYRRRVLREEGRQLSGEQAALEWIEKFAGQFPPLAD